jgi:Na+-transporting NADH:ubiquinone oxidoreductase subunit C
MRFAGPGLWGPIKGFMAMDPKITKIQGITFYEQEETPGLGGEIVNASFRDKFVGLLIRGQDGKPGIIIKNGGEAAANKVDGISGATMTCDKVQEMLNEAIKSIVEEKQ